MPKVAGSNPAVSTTPCGYGVIGSTRSFQVRSAGSYPASRSMSELEFTFEWEFPTEWEKIDLPEIPTMPVMPNVSWEEPPHMCPLTDPANAGKPMLYYCPECGPRVWC